MPPMTANAKVRDQLKEVRSALSTKRDERAGLVAARDQAKEAYTTADISPEQMLESTEFKDTQQAVKALGECDDGIADLQQQENGLLGILGEDAPAPGENGASASSSGVDALMKRTWDAQAILQGDRFKEFLASGAPTSHHKFGSVNLGQVADRDHAEAFFAGYEASGYQAAVVDSTNKVGAIPADRRGIVPPNLKPLTLLDLIPVGSTDSNSIDYVQVTAIPGSAAETAEGAVKPEETLTTVDATAPVRTIAGWIKVNKQALADVSGLQTLIGTLLPYDVKRRIESQILAGDGSGQNLRGILNTSGLGAPTWVDGDNVADAILRAITVIFLSDGDPNFVALHPLTWQDLLLMRENQAERTGAYLYGTPAAQVAPTIWGLAITNNRAVPADKPLVGDAMAATLLVREGVNVLVSDSDQDDFIRNRATVLAEARVAFPVWRPASFAVAVTADPTP